MTVFPERNLPGDAEDWGRAVEREINSLEFDLLSTSQGSGNDSRFFGGQLSVIASQIDEQVARTTLRSFSSAVSVTGSGTSEPFPRSTQDFSFTVPSGGREAQVEVYAKNANPNWGDVAVFAYLSFQGRIISKLGRMFDTDEVLVISGAPEILYGLANVRLPESGTAVFTLTLVRVGYTAASSTETLTDVEVFVTPAQSTQ